MDTSTIYRRRWGILSVLIVSLLAIVIDLDRIQTLAAYVGLLLVRQSLQG